MMILILILMMSLLASASAFAFQYNGKHGHSHSSRSTFPSTSTFTFTFTFTPSSPSSHTSSTCLFLADEIKEYRKGLSQIHKDPFAGTDPLAGMNRSSSSYSNSSQPQSEQSTTNQTQRQNQNQTPTQTTSCVFKFGGSSLANADRIDHVAHLIKDQISAGFVPRAVVCSAMGKTTNNLLSAGELALDGNVSVETIRKLHTEALDTFGIGGDSDSEDDPEDGSSTSSSSLVRAEVESLLAECEQMLSGVSLLKELSPRSLDRLVSYGERCSVRIVAERLNQIGVKAIHLDAWDAGILTDDQFGDARLLEASPDAVREVFEAIAETESQEQANEKENTNVVAVVTGFLGKNPSTGCITTLGRGGSDLTATALGAALGVDEVQVWKDVDGILSADPRVVPGAIPLDRVSFEEASELAYFGAQVLHPIAMQPAMQASVPVRVKNSYNPGAVGTLIQHERSEEERLVTAITYKKGVTVLDIVSTQMLGAYGFLSRVFDAFATHKLSVDVLASSEVSVSLTLDKKQEQTSIAALQQDLGDCSTVNRKDDRSILTLILPDITRSSEVLATAFSVFAKENIVVEMMSQGASKVNISFIVKTECLERAMTRLHVCFFEGAHTAHTTNNDYNDTEKEEEEDDEAHP